jgi:hypothetical protein
MLLEEKDVSGKSSASGTDDCEKGSVGYWGEGDDVCLGFETVARKRNPRHISP